MRLTGLDLIFWAAGFLEHLALLFVLWYRRRARRFPFLTTLITLSVVRTIVLYFVREYGTKKIYARSYWSLDLFDTVLQFCIAYEIASHVFRPLGVWARDVRGSFIWLVSLSLMIALGITWLASPPAPSWMQAVVTKGDLFSATWMSELFVAMMAMSASAGLPWKTHVAKIAQGLGVYSLVSVLIETGYSYFGAGRGAPAFGILNQARMVIYLSCVTYWIIMLWREERPSREMTEEMRVKLFTLQRWVEYDLQRLRSRNKW